MGIFIGGSMKKSIIFTNTERENVSDQFYPQPSSSYLPEWYKKTQGYIGSNKDIGSNLQTNGTIKKCIPVFDALTAGYIIPTYCDIIVKKNEHGHIDFISSSGKAVEFHSITQAPYHPYMNHHPYPKWINPWSIKTPPGYSSLFIPPVHGGNKYFTIIEGFVDTDKYFGAINFPFVLDDINFEGLIPAGTPVVQVIPVKRDKWESTLGDKKSLEESKNTMSLLYSRFFDRYKNLFWDRKLYK